MVFNRLLAELYSSIMMVRRVKRVKILKYLGLTLEGDGELNAGVTHRVQSKWKNWKRVSGVLCDRKMKVKIKGKLYG